MDKLLKTQKTKLVKKQNQLKKKFKLDCATKYSINNNKIVASNNYEKLMIANFHIIGTYNNKTCIWRWAWSNKHIPCKYSNLSKKTLDLGANYAKPKINGKQHAFKFMVASSMFDKSIEGYLIYKKPNSNLLVYMLLKNCTDPKKSKQSKKTIKRNKSKKSKLKSC
jgi:hypothetical protein